MQASSNFQCCTRDYKLMYSPYNIENLKEPGDNPSMQHSHNAQTIRCLGQINSTQKTLRPMPNKVAVYSVMQIHNGMGKLKT